MNTILTSVDKSWVLNPVTKQKICDFYSPAVNGAFRVLVNSLNERDINVKNNGGNSQFRSKAHNIIIFLKTTIFWDITPCSPLKVKALHGVVSQKIIPFVSTAVITSNPTIIFIFIFDIK
jgi:hypothetical protein